MIKFNEIIWEIKKTDIKILSNLQNFNLNFFYF